MNTKTTKPNNDREEFEKKFIEPPDSDIGWIVRSDINPIFLETVTNKTLKKKLWSWIKKYGDERVEEALDNAINKKFPTGEREWCVQCAKRIKKFVSSSKQT